MYLMLDWHLLCLYLTNEKQNQRNGQYRVRNELDQFRRFTDAARRKALEHFYRGYDTALASFRATYSKFRGRPVPQARGKTPSGASTASPLPAVTNSSVPDDVCIYAVGDAVSYTHLTLPTIYSV